MRSLELLSIGIIFLTTFAAPAKAMNFPVMGRSDLALDIEGFQA
jgi:hypothetical protein